MFPKRAAILIPVYNHGETIADVSRRAIATGLPVILVDDGSTDPVEPLVRGLDCTLLHHQNNMGKGTALLTGFRYGAEKGYEAIITLDADGQHDPAEAARLLAEAEKSEAPMLVIGNRLMSGKSVPRSSTFGRDFSNFWVRLETGVDLGDTQSGFRLYPVQELLNLNFSKSRYDYEIEVLVKSLWAGLQVAEVEISVHYPPADERISHFDKFRDNVRLSLLHTTLVSRRLLPLPHKKLTRAKEIKEEPSIISKNPFKVLGELCRSHVSPVLLAAAVWLGLFMGALPLIACHTVAIIYVSHRLHLNKVAAVAASQFCAPPLVPALCIEVGYFLRTGTFLLDLSWERWLLEIHERIWEWLLGSLIVGPVLGLIGGTIVYLLALQFRSIRQQQQTPVNGDDQ